MAGANGDDTCYTWCYNPNLPVAIITTIIFAGLTAAHTWRLVKSRAWFCVPFVVGGIFEIIGYAARAAAHDKTDTLGAYIIQYLLLLVAPALFAASIYMILGRIIRATGAEQYSIIRVNWLTKIFVTGDVICFVVQMGGGGIQASGDGKNYDTGKWVVLVGLILQIIVFLFFLVAAGLFWRRLRQQPTAISMESSLPWERLMWILFAVSILVTIRNLIRVIEYGMGHDGYLLLKEWTLYVFDALPMAATLLICLAWYHSHIQQPPKKVDAMSMEEQMAQPK